MTQMAAVQRIVQNKNNKKVDLYQKLNAHLENYLHIEF